MSGQETSPEVSGIAVENTCPLCNQIVDNTETKATITLDATAFHITCLASPQFADDLLKHRNELKVLEGEYNECNGLVRKKQQAFVDSLKKQVLSDKELGEKIKSAKIQIKNESNLVSIEARKEEIKNRLQEMENTQKLIAEFKLMMSQNSLTDSKRSDIQHETTSHLRGMISKLKPTNPALATLVNSLIECINAEKSRSRELALASRRIFSLIVAQKYDVLMIELGKDTTSSERPQPKTIGNFVHNCKALVKEKFEMAVAVAKHELQDAQESSDAYSDDQLGALKENVAKREAELKCFEDSDDMKPFVLMSKVLHEFLTPVGHFTAKAKPDSSHKFLSYESDTKSASIPVKVPQDGWVWEGIATRLLHVFGLLSQWDAIETKVSSTDMSKLLVSCIAEDSDKEEFRNARKAFEAVCDKINPRAFSKKYPNISHPADRVNCLALWRIMSEMHDTRVPQSRILLQQLRILEETLTGVLVRTRVGASASYDKSLWIRKFSIRPIERMRKRGMSENWNSDTEEYLALTSDLKYLIICAEPALALIRKYGCEANHPNQGKNVFQTLQDARNELSDNALEFMKSGISDAKSNAHLKIIYDRTVEMFSLENLRRDENGEYQWGLYLVPPLMHCCKAIVSQYLKCLNEIKKN